MIEVMRNLMIIGGGTNKNFCGNGDNNDGDHELEGCSLAIMMLVIIFMAVTLRAKFANILLMTWSMVVVIVMIGKMLMMMMTVLKLILLMILYVLLMKTK